MLDVTGNVSTARTFSYTVYGVGLKVGRITGSSTTPSALGNVSASFTLRCDGSPNQLTLRWGWYQSFTLDRVSTTGDPSSSTGYASWCWASGQPTSPNAPIDSIRMFGEGHLANGTKVLIDFSLLDRREGNSCKGADLARFTIRTTSGVVLLSSEGRITKGNIQAHASTGNGTNNNGTPNGPNGHHDRDWDTSRQSSTGSHSADKNDKYQQEKSKRRQAPSTTTTTVDRSKSNRGKSRHR